MSDDIDRAQDAEAQFRLDSLANHQRRVAAALGPAHAPVTVCDTCCAEIDPRRLNAVPTATLCIDCATVREKWGK